MDADSAQQLAQGLHAFSLIMVLVETVVGLIGLGILVWILWFVYTCYEAIPPEHRKMSSGLVWLMLIPCFGLIWMFFVFPGLARSYQSYFAAKGVTDVANCGETLAWLYCIFTITICLSPIGLILLIVFLVKAAELKRRVLETA